MSQVIQAIPNDQRGAFDAIAIAVLLAIGSGLHSSSAGLAFALALAPRLIQPPATITRSQRSPILVGSWPR